MIICDISALDVYRASRFQTFHKPLWSREAQMVLDPNSFSISAREANRFRNDGIRGIDSFSDIHVLVPSERARHNVKGLSFHTWTGTVSANMLIPLTKDLYIVSPEFLFLMLARTFEMPLLAEIGMELCGCYEVSPYWEPGRLRPAPLTCTESIETFLRLQEGSYGVKKARKALTHIADNSWSPMETKTYLLLCLSRCHGGYGIPKPLLNYRLDLDFLDRPIDGRDRFYLDAFWESAGFAVEYDGKDSHFNRIDIIRDKRRLSTLALLSIDTIMLTSADVFNASAMDSVAERICKRLGVMKAAPNSRMLRKRIKLRNVLLFERA